jgi:hypothetical protein
VGVRTVDRGDRGSGDGDNDDEDNEDDDITDEDAVADGGDGESQDVMVLPFFLWETDPAERRAGVWGDDPWDVV